MSGTKGEGTPSDAFAATVLGGTATASQDTLVPAAGAGGPLKLPALGYELGEVIGQGGMGEVVSAHDLRIGRHVAIKRMRAERPTDAAIARFLREARIQARLDHPALVPVHELGVDADGRPYFTMKRLSGVTLAKRMADRGAQKPLLRAFVDVCLAIEFAHTRGVVHRDLKPSNIMVGDFGEVYVLDWGIARVLHDDDAVQARPADIDTLDDGTRTGDLLGTPGYMAPEQVRGEAAGPQADVYALGAMMFEILCGEPLHPRGEAAFASTLSAAQQAPARRRPERDIAPELDRACTAALAEVASARPTARQLAERVQSYLDGDRDVEARKAVAAERLATARAKLDSGDPEARAAAAEAAARALIFDPTSADAVRLVSALILEPPDQLPAALVSELAGEDREAAVVRLRAAAYTMLIPLAFALLLPFMTVRSWTTLGIGYGVLAGIAALLFVAAHRKKSTVTLSLVSGLALGVAFTRVAGPFMLTPIVVTGGLLAITANPALMERPWTVLVWLAATVFGPQLLETVGVFSRSWWITGDEVLTHSAMFAPGRSDAIALLIGNFALLASVGYFALLVNRRSREARRQALIQRWHLDQMLPAGRISVR